MTVGEEQSMSERGFEPHWRPARGPALHVDGRGISIVAVAAVLLFVSLVLRAPLWIVVVVAALLSLFVLALSSLAGKQREAFDRGFLRLAQRGEGHSIRTMMRRYPLVRWWSPPVDFQTKIGLVAASIGEDGEAERALEMAWIHADSARRRALVGPLCRVKFRLRRWQEVAELSADWLLVEGNEGPAAWYRAASLRELGELSAEHLEELMVLAGPVREPSDEEAQLLAVGHDSNDV